MSLKAIYSILFLVALASCNLNSIVDKEGFITLEKGGCMGPCKVYIMTIYGDGTCVLDGRQKIEHIGHFEGKMRKKELNELWTQLEEAKLFELKDQYGYGGNDTQAKFITFKHEGKTKKIRYKHGEPSVIRLLEKQLEEIATSNRWEHVEQ